MHQEQAEADERRYDLLALAKFADAVEAIAGGGGIGRQRQEEEEALLCFALFRLRRAAAKVSEGTLALPPPLLARVRDCGCCCCCCCRRRCCCCCCYNQY